MPRKRVKGALGPLYALADPVSQGGKVGEKKKQEQYTAAPIRLARAGQFLSDRAFRLNVILDSYSEQKFIPRVEQLALMLGCSLASLKRAQEELHGKRIKKISSGYRYRNKNKYVPRPPEEWELSRDTPGMTKKRRGFKGKSQFRKGTKMPARPNHGLLHPMNDSPSLSEDADTSLSGVLTTPLNEQVLDQDLDHLIRSTDDATSQWCPTGTITGEGEEKGGLPAPIITVKKPHARAIRRKRGELPAETEALLEQLEREKFHVGEKRLVEGNLQFLDHAQETLGLESFDDRGKFFPRNG